MLAFLMMIADEQYTKHIERLYMRHHKHMIRLAEKRFTRAKRNNPESDAEDAVQATFLAIVRYAHVVPFEKSERELGAYVFAILENEVNKILGIPELNCQNGVENYEDDDELQAFAECIHIKEQYAAVVKEIQNMDMRYSTVLMLHYCEEMPVKGIASLLGISEKTIYTRLRRGRQQLIEKFSKEGGI